ncbi:MAG: flagellar hook-basal body complex protein [Alphaproteobacteria bacterium]
MSLYGALFSGVSSLKAQSNKIGVISDNISNVNTIGYKGGQGNFRTLVTSASGTTAYSPGGVLGGNRQLISKQGLLQTTDSPTDIAVSGAGFFVVNQTPDGEGNILFTRAGSFTQDSLGNFRNSGGFFLQAWPLDREGRLPGEPGNTTNTISSANLESLTTVNVQNLTGTASATSTVSLSANLNAAQAAFAGASAIVDMNNQHAINFGIKAADVIIPGGSNGLIRGDAFTVTSDGGVNATFTYGGFTFSRIVSTGLSSDLGGAALGNGQTNLANNPLGTTNGSNVVTVNFPAAHGLATGAVITLSSVGGAVSGIPAAELNASHVVTVVDADTVTITVTTNATATGATVGGAGIVADSRPFAGQILDATTVTQAFLGTTGTSGFTTAGLTFSITTASTGTSTFTYSASTPNAQFGEFNNMTNLAAAINAVDGLTARVDTANGQLYVSATNATEAITFANGSTVGTSGPPVQAGIDWVSELGFANVAAAGSTLRFSTMEGLADLVNSVDGLAATTTNPLGTSSVTISLSDPLGVITFDDDGAGGSLLTELGFFGNIAQTTQETLGPLGPAYDPNDSAKNMASGAITPQFSRQLQIFDALGASHSLTMAFLKLSTNTWGVEVFAVPASDVSTADGIITNGTVTFNGDGTLLSLSNSLTDPVTIQWETTGSDPTEVSFDLGTQGPPGTGATDGLGQFSAAYRVNFVNQNGAPVGDLTSVAIDENGFIIANYSNGQTQSLYKIPVAKFPNPDQLTSLTGNVFAQSADSGEVNLNEPGISGTGKIAAASLEQSNVELAEQLTDMIVAQRAYQAGTKVITTADSLLEELNRLLQ